MNPNSQNSDERGDGAQAASNSKPLVTTPDSPDSAKDENMKRAAAKQLIERYYYQLTDGCGNSECTNANCASNPIQGKSVSGNEAAVRALALFKSKAPLCENKPSKVAKPDEGASTSGACGEVAFVKTVSNLRASTSAASAAEIDKPSPPVTKEVPTLSLEKLKNIIAHCEAEANWSLLIRTIGQVFNNPESLSKSFRKEAKSKEELHAMQQDMDKDTDEKASEGMEEGDGEPPGGASVTVKPPHSLREDEVTVDMDSVRESYSTLFAIPSHPFQASLINALICLARDIEMDLKYRQAYDSDPNYLNIFLIVMEIPSLHSPEYIEKAFPNFCKATGLLPIGAQAKLAKVWSKFSPARLKEMVETLHQLVTVKVITGEFGRMHCVNDDEGISGASRVMKIVYNASILGGVMDAPEVLLEEKAMNESADDGLQELLQGAVGHEPKEKNQPREDILAKHLGVHPIDCREPVVPFEEFINEPLNENIEMDKDYTYYKSDKFSFMDHCFILTTATKNLGMYFDNRIRMINERRTSLLQSFVHGAPPTPYLRLRIRRDHIIDDALVALEMAAMDNPQDLKKQLYVEFEDEQGIDEGGVSKEFFQLVVEEIFNPDIGMFTYDEETRNFWFNQTSFENDGQFTLIGIVLGLAIYNNVILDVHFPMVVYRKLMGKKGTFDDLKVSHPTLAKGLQDMLVFEGNVEETFMQSFQIGYTDVFGATLTHNLKEGGSELMVNNDNRQEFVDLYADFLLNKAVEKQFRAFKRGFLMVTDESPLKLLFRPEEVELLVCGSKHLDFHALQEATEYDGGFNADSATVKNFWEVVHEFDEDQKRQLLQFTTGSDRVPIGGLAKLKLIVARNGPDSERLPTSHTCFNVLLLPDYTAKDKLKERLLKAITHAKGFGML